MFTHHIHNHNPSNTYVFEVLLTPKRTFNLITCMGCYLELYVKFYMFTKRKPLVHAFESENIM